MKLWAALTALVLILATAGFVSAGTVVPFSVFENADGADVSGFDISVEFDAGGDFTFFNDSTDFNSLTRIFFEDGFEDLLDSSAVSLTKTTTVEFESKTNGGDLPGGTNISWAGYFEKYLRITSSGAKDSYGNPIDFGVNPGESITISFDLITGTTESDIFDKLVFGDGRIGIHVQRLTDADGKGDLSVSAVTVPLPSGVWAGLGLLGGIGLIQIVRRRRRASAI